jgi:hypothetical protein
VGKQEGKRSLGRKMRRWLDNIRMDLLEILGCIGPFKGNRRERDRLGDLGVNGWIILEWISGETECILSWWGNRSERDHWGN